MLLKIPYDRTYLEAEIDDSRLAGIVTPKAHEYVPQSDEITLVKKALENPISSERLCDLARNVSKMLVITSDHTRPVPSRITLPLLLEEARRYNPGVEIKILIATGLHRKTTESEMKEKFGEEVVSRETFIVHDACDDSNMVYKGILPSGGELWLNSLVDWADLVVAEGFIEPHFFAGFSGGRKSILPGIASRKTVLANHCADFIENPRATTGNLKDNPIHKDMIFAAKTANLKFILNVAIDHNKKIINAFAGDFNEAHIKGCEFVSDLFRAKAVKGDIIITSNGGYPLDQNIYQAVKGMTAAEASANENAVIVMVSACRDGHGGEAFYKYFADASSPADVMENILKVPMCQTEVDQWQAQILARVMIKHKVIMVSDPSVRDLITDMGMYYAGTLQEGLELANKIAGADAKITVIPDGVGVIVE